LFPVLRRGQPMASGAKVLGNGTIRGQESLGMPCGLEPLHAMLPLARRPMGVLTPVIERATLAMFHPGQDLPFYRAITLALVCDDHPWHVLQALEQLAKELLRRVLVAAALHQGKRI